jgi:hypothetical protein
MLPQSNQLLVLLTMKGSRRITFHSWSPSCRLTTIVEPDELNENHYEIVKTATDIEAGRRLGGTKRNSLVPSCWMRGQMRPYYGR